MKINRETIIKCLDAIEAHISIKGMELNQSRTEAVTEFLSGFNIHPYENEPVFYVHGEQWASHKKSGAHVDLLTEKNALTAAAYMMAEQLRFQQVIENFRRNGVI